MNQQFAVIKTGGKQYVVSPGQTIDIDRLAVQGGEVFRFDAVLLVREDDKVMVGAPKVAGYAVEARVAEPLIKAAKIFAFKYKPKKRYRRKVGHRQQYTRVEIVRFITPKTVEVNVVLPQPKAKPRPKKAPADVPPRVLSPDALA